MGLYCFDTSVRDTYKVKVSVKDFAPWYYFILPFRLPPTFLLLLPLLQQLDDSLLHALRRIGAREVFA